MEVNFELLNTFYHVAKIGNITKASETLYVSQPAITKSIKKLENILEITLFTRNRKGVELTHEGKILFDYIEPHINGLINSADKLRSLKDLDEGSITIGAGTNITKIVLIPNILKFSKCYPKIKFKIIHSKSANLIKDLQYGNLDLILLNLPRDLPDNLSLITCKTIQDCFVANAKYTELSNLEINVKDLNNYPLVLGEKNSNTRDFLDNLMAEHDVILEPKYELSSITLVSDFVKSGIGIGYLPIDFIKKEIERKELIKLKVSIEIPQRHIGIITNKQILPNYATQKFIQFIMNENSN